MQSNNQAQSHSWFLSTLTFLYLPFPFSTILYLSSPSLLFIRSFPFVKFSSNLLLTSFLYLSSTCVQPSFNVPSLSFTFLWFPSTFLYLSPAFFAYLQPSVNLSSPSFPFIYLIAPSFPFFSLHLLSSLRWPRIESWLPAHSISANSIISVFSSI